MLKFLNVFTFYYCDIKMYNSLKMYVEKIFRFINIASVKKYSLLKIFFSCYLI